MIIEIDYRTNLLQLVNQYREVEKPAYSFIKCFNLLNGEAEKFPYVFDNVLKHQFQARVVRSAKFAGEDAKYIGIELAILKEFMGNVFTSKRYSVAYDRKFSPSNTPTQQRLYTAILTTLFLLS